MSGFTPPASTTQEKLPGTIIIKEAQSLSGKIYDLNGLVNSEESQGAKMLESLNPWGFGKEGDSNPERLKFRSKPRVAAVRMTRLLQDEVVDC